MLSHVSSPLTMLPSGTDLAPLPVAAAPDRVGLFRFLVGGVWSAHWGVDHKATEAVEWTLDGHFIRSTREDWKGEECVSRAAGLMGMNLEDDKLAIWAYSDAGLYGYGREEPPTTSDSQVFVGMTQGTIPVYWRVCYEKKDQETFLLTQQRGSSPGVYSKPVRIEYTRSYPDRRSGRDRRQPNPNA